MSDREAWSDERIKCYIAEMSQMLGLKIEPEYEADIVMFLQLAAEMAGTLDRADLSATDADLAPVFRLPRPIDNDG